MTDLCMCVVFHTDLKSALKNIRNVCIKLFAPLVYILLSILDYSCDYPQVLLNSQLSQKALF